MAPLGFPRRLRGASIQAEERPKRAIPYCASHERNRSENQRNRRCRRRQAAERTDSDHDNSHDDSNRAFHSAYIACHDSPPEVGVATVIGASGMPKEIDAEDLPKCGLPIACEEQPRE